MVVLSDVMEDLLEVFLGLIGQIGQILDSARVNAGLADRMNTKNRAREMVMCT